MFFEIRKFPIFGKVDVFSTKNDNFSKNYGQKLFPQNLKMDQIKEWKLTVLNNRCAVQKKWKWTSKIEWLWTILNVGLKSSLHYLLSIFELSAWIHRTANFHVKDSHLWSIDYIRDSDRLYSLLETIQFKSRPCTLEWTVYSHIDRWHSSVRQSTLPQESWVRTVHYY